MPIDPTKRKMMRDNFPAMAVQFPDEPGDAPPPEEIDAAIKKKAAEIDAMAGDEEEDGEVDPRIQRLLLRFGPPDCWKGDTRQMLGRETVEQMEKAWKGLSPEEQQKLRDAYEAKDKGGMRAEVKDEPAPDGIPQGAVAAGK